MSIPVSVVVPTYNRAYLIGETLESILDQTAAPAEVIVVDDGSTDDTETVVREFSGRVIYHRIENSGVCHARKIGASLTESPLIAFCDSDDLWKREKLSRQVDLHEQGGVEYSFTNFRTFSGDEWNGTTKFDTAPAGFFKGFETTPHGLIQAHPLYDGLLEFQPIFPSTAMISRRLYNAIGGFKSELGRMRSEDWEFALRCVQQGPIGAIVEPLVGIRKHEGNISGNVYRQTCSEVEILKYVLKNHALTQHSRELASKQIVKRSIESGVGAFERSEFENCKNWFTSVPLSALSYKDLLKLLVVSFPEPVAEELHRFLTRWSAVWRSRHTSAWPGAS